MLRSTVFVPAPAGKPGAPAAACAAAVLGAAGNAHADAIGDAAAKLSKAAYPFMKEVPWNSGSYNLPAGSADPIGYTKAQLMAINAALGRMIAPVPESTTMGVYSAVGGLMGPKVPACLMSTVKESDARAAYNAFIDFTQVVKANPITPSAPTSSVSGSAASSIAAAADELSAAAYPFVEDIDWTSDLYSKPTLGADPQKVAKAIGNMITMGAAMDGASLKEADIAHVKAIGGMDAKGVLLQSDFAPINAGLGKAVASVPTSKVMDVYNSMAQGVGSPGVPNKLSSTENPADAQAARGALLEFKDVAKAAQR
ncbi:unnamed protein product [Prorocentrum cordatum]|uniref:Chloroplast soluble peridinin-chlorophyll a-binding protein n=1 Tax=Prorocentrum cordatum TaxID=2364126 RepID=A0ABN9RW84_9DINO|nr:unnamed protein product [Polarella glacialis]